MNLVIDIGNSLAKIALFDENQIIKSQSMSKLTIEILNKILDENPTLQKVIYSSVSKTENEVIQFLEQHFNYFLKFNSTTDIPIKNGYETPKTLGLDRLAAAIGANSLFPNTDILVIDAGTAITYDIVTSKGEFLGGNISPGLETRFRSLHQFTNSLPLINAADKWNFIGKNTEDAIRAGVQNGIIFEIDAMINKVKEQFPKIITVITGGGSFFFDKKLKNTIFAKFEITLIGLNHILEYNAKKR